MSYYVYILANKRNGTLYTGFTNNLSRRVYEHRQGLYSGFTRKYKVYNLVYFEEYQDLLEGQQRETRVKKWKRAWKMELIERMNPDWEDLYQRLNM